MNKGTHLLIKFIPSDKEVLPIQFMFIPSQFYMTFVQHIYTCKGECAIDLHYPNNKEHAICCHCLLLPCFYASENLWWHQKSGPFTTNFSSLEQVTSFNMNTPLQIENVLCISQCIVVQLFTMHWWQQLHSNYHYELFRRKIPFWVQAIFFVICINPLPTQSRCTWAFVIEINRSIFPHSCCGRDFF